MFLSKTTGMVIAAEAHVESAAAASVWIANVRVAFKAYYALKPWRMCVGSEEFGDIFEIAACSPGRNGRTNYLDHRVEAGKLLAGNRLDFACLAGLSEGGHTGDANLLHGVAGRLQVIAGVEFLGRLG